MEAVGMVNLEGIYYDIVNDQVLHCEKYTNFPWLDDQYMVMAEERIGIIISGKALMDDMLDNEVVFICDM